MLNKINIDTKKIPFIFLLILVATFGLLIPKLGFYWDDWPVIFLTETQGTAGFWDFYQYDRPFSAWTYIVTTPILGTNPIGWHIYTLLLRWLTVVFLWLSLRKIWPGKPKQTSWIAMLFSVYPLFNQQPVAVAYSQHWTCYLFYFVSVYLMLASQKNKRFYYPLVLSSTFFSLIQMFTMEYFLGLELFRPIILLTYYHNQESTPKKLIIIKKAIFTSWPYLLLLGAYVVWRIFFLELAGNDPNDLVFLAQLMTTPFKALLNLIQTALQDLVYFFSSWFVALNPTDIEIQRPFFIVSTGVAIVTTVLLWAILGRYNTSLHEEETDTWHLQAVLFGIVSTVFATLPVWIIGRQASLGLYGSRFGLAGMFGLSVALVGILEWLSNRNQVKNTVICILIAVAIHFHLYIAKDFQESWEKQQRVYWQLHWRAPYIQPKTAIISDGEIFMYVGEYSTAMGIALLYPPTETPNNMDYWFFSMGRDIYIMKKMEAGTQLTGSLRNYFFEGDSKNSLLLYLPGINQCLRVLSTDDIYNKDIPNLLQPVLGISNLGRIERNGSQGWLPPKDIFGIEPDHTWCYYFEKAELARQYGEWEEIIQLYKTGEHQGYKPSEMIEYFPLLDAYLHTNKIDTAYQLSIQMRRRTNKIDDQICRLWLRNIEEQSNPNIKPVYEQIKVQINCFD